MALRTPATMTAAAPPRAGSPWAWLRAGGGGGVFGGAFLLVLLIGEADGGYFPTTWNWGLLALSWVAGLIFIFNTRAALGRLELAFLAALLLFVAWTAFSIVWSRDVEGSVLEVQRALLYVVAVVVALLVVSRSSVTHLLAGVLAGATWLSAHGMASRLFPDPMPGVEAILQDRLTGPVGYANAMGVLAVMGALLALGFALHGRQVAVRAAAAAALPILLTAAYFTYSRGAAGALCGGMLAAIAADGRRLAILTKGLLVALPAAAAVWLASRAPALSSSTAAHAAIRDEGRRLAIVLLALIVAAVCIALIIGMLEPRVRIARGVRRAYAAALLGVALALAAGVVIDRGGPVALVDEAYQSFNRDLLPTDPGDPNDLNRRLGSIGSTPRVNFWKVAWRQHEQHPAVGAGAGTYEQFWVRYRPGSERALDAHSLYLETLAELGWPGLALVVVMLSLPLMGAARARKEPIVAGATGAYVAYLLHAGVDWDWEMPVVTLLALLCGVALIAARDDASHVRCTLPPAARAVGLAAMVGCAVFAIIALAGNQALMRASEAAIRGDFRSAQRDAQAAVRWAPWSAEAHRRVATAQRGLGRSPDARAALRKAAAMNPHDWRIWYDLGIVSSGRERQRAFVRAARLNPRENAITTLRERGYRLPAVRARG